MALSKDELSAIQNHIDAKWKNGCPMCGNRHWLTDGYLTVLFSNDPKVMNVVAGKGTAYASLSCSTCGFTALVNMYVIGLVKP